MADLSKQYGEHAAKGFSSQDVVAVREYAEARTLLDSLGDVKGKDVLDLACGAGFYARLASEAGARRVVGIDASAEMIQYAQASTPKELGIEYQVLDAATMPKLGQFDVVTAGFMLNYARNREEMASMCQTVARHLKPGGRFVGTVPNSKHNPATFDRRYGVFLNWTGPMKDGDEYSFTLYISDPPVHLRCHYWQVETYMTELERAGLSDPKLVDWRVSQEGMTKYGPEFWNGWTSNPVSVFITAQRAGGAT